MAERTVALILSGSIVSVLSLELLRVQSDRDQFFYDITLVSEEIPIQNTVNTEFFFQDLPKFMCQLSEDYSGPQIDVDHVFVEWNSLIAFIFWSGSVSGRNQILMQGLIPEPGADENRQEKLRGQRGQYLSEVRVQLEDVSAEDVFKVKKEQDLVTIICPRGPAQICFDRPIFPGPAPKQVWTFQCHDNSAWCVGLVPEKFFFRHEYLMYEDRSGDDSATEDENEEEPRVTKIIGFKNRDISGGVLPKAEMHAKPVRVLVEWIPETSKKVISFEFEGNVLVPNVGKCFQIPDDYGYPLKLGICGHWETEILLDLAPERRVVFFLFVSSEATEPFGLIPREMVVVIARTLWELQ